MKNKLTARFSLAVIAMSLPLASFASTNSVAGFVRGTNTSALLAQVGSPTMECRVKLAVTNNADNVFIRTNKAFSLTVVLKNRSTNCNCMIYVGQTCNDSFVSFSCKVLAADGSDVSPVLRKPTWQTGWFEEIKPMRSIALNYDMGSVWTKAKAGDYTVTIEKQLTAYGEFDACCKDHRVTSNPIPVKVLTDIE